LKILPYYRVIGHLNFRNHIGLVVVIGTTQKKYGNNKQAENPREPIKFHAAFFFKDT